MTNWIIQELETDCYCDDMYFQDLLGNCAIYGNRDFKEFMPEWFNNLVVNEQWLEYTIDDIDHFKTDLGMTLIDAVNQALYQDLDLPKDFNQSVATETDAETVYNALKEHYYDFNLTETCNLLKAVTGKVWDYQTIRGYCQSDWNYLFYLKDGTVNIRLIEAEYFGLYTYYSVHANDFDDENDMGLMRVCDFEDFKDVFKKEFGNMLQDGDTVEMRHIKGYTQVPQYKSETIEL